MIEHLITQYGYLAVFLGLILGNAAALLYMYFKGALKPENLTMLIGPGCAAILSASWALSTLANKTLAPRQKGERLMLLGLFWLFVYDATILWANSQFWAGVAITLLLFCAIASFFGLRFLSRPRVDYKPSPPPPRTAKPA